MSSSINISNEACDEDFQTEKYLESHVFKDGHLLKKILEVTLRENLCRQDDSWKVVEFLQPKDLEKVLPLAIAEKGCESAAEIDDIIEKIVKYSVHTTHHHFYNQLYGGVDEVGIMSAWLTEALNTNQYTFEVAPVFVILERVMLQVAWKLFGWEDGDGIFSPGGSIANMYGILLARHRKYPHLKETGLFSQKELVILTSDMSHYSILKAANLMGFGMKQVVRIATDIQGRMTGTALRETVQRVRNEGREPFFVNATAGTTVFGAFDPIEEIALVCQRENLWLHVDMRPLVREGYPFPFHQHPERVISCSDLSKQACWGGSVVLSNNLKYKLRGSERADSIAWNPHKMLCVPLQCSVFLVKYKNNIARRGASSLNPGQPKGLGFGNSVSTTTCWQSPKYSFACDVHRQDLLGNCNRSGASYLFQQDKIYDVSYDLGDKSIQCGRKPDALKLWLMFKVHGFENLGNRIDSAFATAAYLESELRKREGFRLVLLEHDCTNVCFWYIPPTLRNLEETEEWWMKIHQVAPKIKHQMTQSGKLMVGYQPLEPKGLCNFFRMVITAYPISKREDMDFVLNEIEHYGREL